MKSTSFNLWKHVRVFAVAFITAALCIGCGGSSCAKAIKEFSPEVSITPNLVTVGAGETITFEVTVSGSHQELSGDVKMDARVSFPGSNFVKRFTAHVGLAVPHVELVEITVPLGTADGTYKVIVSSEEVNDLAHAIITVGTGGDPTFTFTATPTVISGPNNGLSAEDVAFEVASVNGFSGDVVISWVADADVEPSPTTNNFIGSVAPGAPFTFTRKMRRLVTHGNPVTISFHASKGATTRDVSIDVNKAP
jgi:plastocyanin